MTGLVFLIFAGLIIIFETNGAAVNTQDFDDHNELCAFCNEASLRHCSSDEISRLDNHLYCKQFNCTIAMPGKNESEEMCILVGTEFLAEAPIVEHDTLLQTMETSESLPNALPLQMSSTEDVGAENNEVVEEPPLVESNVGDHANEATENADDTSNIIEHAPESVPNVEVPSEIVSSTENTHTRTERTDQALEETQAVDEVAGVKNEYENIDKQPDNGMAATENDDLDKQPVDEVPKSDDEGVVNQQMDDEAVVKNDDVENLVDKNEKVENNEVEHADAPDYVADAPAITASIDAESPSQPSTVAQHEIEPHVSVDKNEIHLQNTSESEPDTLNGNQVIDKDPTPPIVAPNEQFQSCFTCSSNDDALCGSKPSKVINCKAAEDKQNGCYTLHKHVELKRGCLSELLAPELAACLDDDDKSCLACHSSNCNSDLWPECYTCESSETSPMCAWWSATALKPPYLAKMCPKYSDRCILYVDAAGATVRGCLAENLPAECAHVGMSHCHVCADALCNGGVFPPTRRRCHQCVGGDDCAAAQNATQALPCAVYQSEEKDGCFMYVDGAGSMQRGCTTATQQYESCRSQGNAKCRTCGGTDACNSMPLMLTPTLSCSQCDSRLTDENTPPDACAWAQSNESVDTCRNRYLYYLEQTCQTVYQPDIELAVRGCTLDIGPCEPTNAWCKTCNMNACNTDNLRWEYCVQCSSERETTCATDASQFEASKCPGAVQPYELRGCYTLKDVDTNITTRGCISDLAEEGMKYCKTNKKLCTLCYEAGCNNRLAPSAAAHPELSLVIVALTLFKVLL